MAAVTICSDFATPKLTATVSTVSPSICHEVMGPVNPKGNQPWICGWLYFGGVPKSLQMVTAAMKLKDACSLEEKLWPT